MSIWTHQKVTDYENVREVTMDMGGNIHWKLLDGTWVVSGCTPFFHLACKHAMDIGRLDMVFAEELEVMYANTRRSTERRVDAHLAGLPQVPREALAALYSDADFLAPRQCVPVGERNLFHE